MGKSYLLFQLIDLIKEKNPETQIIYINKEQHEFSSISNAESLFLYLKEQVNPDKNVALFIDEIQDIESFEIVLRDLVNRGVESSHRPLSAVIRKLIVSPIIR